MDSIFEIISNKMMDLGATGVDSDKAIVITTYGSESIREDIYEAEREILLNNPDLTLYFYFHCTD
jgi:hypothetical protein